MKYLILVAVIAFISNIVAPQKDPATVANDCKAKYNITAAEEADISSKKFLSTSANAKSFFGCFCTNTGFFDGSGNLNRTFVVATANGDANMIAKMDVAIKNCTSKSTVITQKIWDISPCFFNKTAA